MLFYNKNTRQPNLISDTVGIKWMGILLFGGLLLLLSCENFVEIDSPRNLFVTEDVFKNAATAESALANIYTNLREQSVLNGTQGMSLLLGCYSDEFTYLQNSLDIVGFYQHTLTANNNIVKGWWTSAYNGIYGANDIIAGVAQSTELSESDKEQLTGQALFIRALLHSYLVGLHGDIPYITTTDYAVNNKVERIPEAEVYSHIITDLEEAIPLLNIRDMGEERVVPDQTTAKALLARIYLYTENWEQAEKWATEVIQTPGYELEIDVTKVFLKESSEAIWQFKPDMINNFNSWEAAFMFIKSPFSLRQFVLTKDLISAFESGDIRKEIWVGELLDPDTNENIYFASKYTKDFATREPIEYSIVFRLAEQYLIRAEAKAQLGQIQEAQADLNILRNRASLPDTPAQTKEELLAAVIQERRVELFTENGHRWFDLKRTGQAEAILSSIKSNWINTDLLLPIPEAELEVNPIFNRKMKDTNHSISKL